MVEVMNVWIEDLVCLVGERMWSGGGCKMLNSHDLVYWRE